MSHLRESCLRTCWPRSITSFKIRGLAFLAEIARGVYELPHLDRHEIEHAASLVSKDRDLKIGLADASIVALSARFRCRTVLTLDERHFRAMRFGTRQRFRILPADASE